MCRMNLQFSTIAVRMHFFMFYMRICAYFGVRFMSIGVDFVLGPKQTLKRNLLNNSLKILLDQNSILLHGILFEFLLCLC